MIQRWTAIACGILLIAAASYAANPENDETPGFQSPTTRSWPGPMYGTDRAPVTRHSVTAPPAGAGSSGMGSVRSGQHNFVPTRPSVRSVGTWNSGISGPALRREPVTWSPSYNTRIKNPPVFQHQSTVANIEPKPGQWYASWGSGFIIGGGRHTHPGCHPNCHWIGGFWTYRPVRIWVPAQYVERVVPARYEYQVINGQIVPVVVQEAHRERIYVPGRYETQYVRVWIPGRWLCQPEPAPHPSPENGSGAPNGNGGP